MTYVNNITDHYSLNKIIPHDNVIFAHKSNNTIKHLFKNTKDKINKTDRCNVVYEIPCKGTNGQQCDQIYIGQTKRSLQTRLLEHESDIKKNRNITGISQHMLTHTHTPDFDNTKILDIEPKQNRRFILEGLYIKKNIGQTMNHQEDTNQISKSYDLIISDVR